MKVIEKVGESSSRLEEVSETVRESSSPEGARGVVGGSPRATLDEKSDLSGSPSRWIVPSC